MRRFRVHFVTEIAFVDGDEASDAAALNYKKHLAETVRTRPRTSRSGPSRAPGSRLSWSKKSRRRASNNPTTTYGAVRRSPGALAGPKR
jgi:hypothetical protein